MWLRQIGVVLCWSSLILATHIAEADDTELFIYDFNKAGDFRPKVLLIFDTSGSMKETMQVSEAYDPAKIYPALPNDPDASNSKKYIYFSSNSSVPSINSSARFPDSVNACATSKSPLSSVGQFVSAVWTYKETNFLFWRYWSWASIRGEQENDIKLVDCQQDVTVRNTANPYRGTLTVAAGYPIKGNSNATTAYTADVANAYNNNTGITLYSANYIRWYHGPGQPVNKSRLSIAKNAITELISSTPGVDFGLAVFNENDNGSTNGGRIVRNILGSETTLGNGKTGEQDLLDKVNALNADGNTPLCETLQEAYQFFGGKSVVYGTQGGSLSPARDTSAEKSDGTYRSPYDNCSNNGYVIYHVQNLKRQAN
ncbi:VWA domain-containing protein [Aeromonas caviae]|uniref:vWA domain-containing protein n=1 Tax=Aeromonas caviae TaxID=648 RepID=UPI0038CFAE1A